jgi:hypothetical protein
LFICFTFLRLRPIKETYLDEDQYGYAFVESDRDSKIHHHKKNKVTGKKQMLCKIMYNKPG